MDFIDLSHEEDRARAESQRAVEEQLENERLRKEERDAQEKRTTRQEETRREIDDAFDRIENRAEKTISPAMERADVLGRIKRAVKANPLLDDGDPEALVRKCFLGLFVLLIAFVIDFVVLSSVSMLLLSMASITAAVLIFLGKLILPSAIIGLELAVAMFREKTQVEQYRRVLERLTFALPFVVTLILIATFLADRGIFSLSELDLITGIILVGLPILAYASHAMVVYFGFEIFAGLAYMWLLYRRHRFKKLNVEYEKKTHSVFLAYQLYLRLLERYNETYETQLVPQFDRLSLLARTVIRRYLRTHDGYEPTEPVGSTPPSIPLPNGTRAS